LSVEPCCVVVCVVLGNHTPGVDSIEVGVSELDVTTCGRYCARRGFEGTLEGCRRYAFDRYHATFGHYAEDLVLHVGKGFAEAFSDAKKGLLALWLGRARRVCHCLGVPHGESCIEVTAIEGSIESPDETFGTSPCHGILFRLRLIKSLVRGQAAQKVTERRGQSR